MLSKVFIVLMTIALFCTPAYAATIEGSSSGIFINPVGPTGMVTSGVGTNSFSWGTGYTTPPSRLTFTGSSVISTEFDTLFSFGTLSYFNGAIYTGTVADQVSLSVNLSLTAPSGLSQDFTYDLSLINTLNSGGPVANADFVVFPTVFPSSSFSIGGTDYTLAFAGFGEIGSGGFSLVDQFHVYEGSTASAQLFGKITEQAAPVPEPSTILLLGSGLLGLGLYGRKRKKA